MEDEIQTKKYFGLQENCPSLLTELKEPTTFAAHALEKRGMKCQETTSNGCRDTEENVLRSTSKVSFVIDRFQPNLCQS